MSRSGLIHRIGVYANLHQGQMGESNAFGPVIRQMTDIVPGRHVTELEASGPIPGC